MATLQEFTKDISLLLEVGLIAIKQGDEESAKKIFNALGVLSPQGSGKKMGYGLIALHKMDLKNAQKNFTEVLQAEPTNYRAQTFLSFACMLLAIKDPNFEEQVKNLKKSAELAHEVVEKCDLASTKQFAQSIIDWQEDLKQKATTSRGPVG